MAKLYRLLTIVILTLYFSVNCLHGADHIRKLQRQAVDANGANWGHWGLRPDLYSNWNNHTNRLIPVYTFGTDLRAYRDHKSIYRRPKELVKLYGRLPEGTLNPSANYFDQTQLYDLQMAALASEKKFFFLVIFDGMDWDTSRAAAIYRSGRVGYHTGRGRGLSFQDYAGVSGDFGYMVTSPHNIGSQPNPDTQMVEFAGGTESGGYHPELGGASPWSRPRWPHYLTGQLAAWPHPVTDSAASATAMTSGKKTYNSAINTSVSGTSTMPIARTLQKHHGFAVGAVTSVPISHATPACAYANNVTRLDYQDLSRDLLGLPSISHSQGPLPGLDVLIGAGWGINFATDPDQGSNFVPGNRFLAPSDAKRITNRYQVVQRTAGISGTKALSEGADLAAQNGRRLFGFFGTRRQHLPFQTADGDFNPVESLREVEVYTAADRNENPALSDMTAAAIRVLEQNQRGFWLMVEAGDVDWANHDNNIDTSIGAVLSGAAAFDVITNWVEENNCWDKTIVIVAADHGHLLFLRKPASLIAPVNTLPSAR